MPQTATTLTVPDKDDITVIETKQYGTLWTQYLTDTPGSTLVYVILAPFFFMSALITCLSRNPVILTYRPNDFPVHLPSTQTENPTHPVALTSDYQTMSQMLGSSRVRLFVMLIYAYFKRTPIALQIGANSDPIISSDKYIVTEDEESIRPIVLFR